jgi:N-acetylated-alpha-linked acidic dipeptidase
MKRVLLALGSLIILSTRILFPGHSPAPPREDSYPWPPAQESQALEARYKAAVSTKHIRSFLEAMTKEPHPPGSAGDKDVEDYIFAQFKSFGLDPQWSEYEILLSSHVSSELEIVYPKREVLNLYEDRVPEDPFSRRTGEFPAWSVYGASGTAEGEVVYANFGTAADFRLLKERDVDLKGKILLMRFYNGDSGTKLERTQLAGGAGALFFSDPLDDGYFWGDVYPEGAWRPLSGIQRTAVDSGPIPGDLQTPGWASVKGADRLPMEDLKGLPKIPSLPISAREAKKLLKQLAGTTVPWQWNGAMGFTYRMGPGPVRVRLKARNRLEIKPIRNITVFVPGEQFPDQWILLGNHHDAHIFGAGDPNSGTAVQLEFARILGSWLKQGWRPRRSIMINNWCAEEYGLSGSTEWVEEHAAAVRDKVVVNLNSDSAVFNIDTPLYVTASPSLIPLIQQVAASLLDPRSGRRFSDVWLEQQHEYSNWFSSMGTGWQILPGEPRADEPKIDPSPGIDDNMPFFFHLVVPGTDMFYGTDYGMYHSVYENFHWMSKVIDPGFRYNGLMAQLWGLLALRMANEDLIPLDYVNFARHVGRALAELEPGLSGEFRTEFIGLKELCQEWKEAAEQVQRKMAGSPSPDGSSLEKINTAWYRLERAFYHDKGLPGNPWFKNLFIGPVAGLENENRNLPGLAQALCLKDLDMWKEQSAIYRSVLKRLINETRQVLSLLGSS